MQRAPRKSELPTQPESRAKRTKGLTLTMVPVLVLLLAACQNSTPAQVESPGAGDLSGGHELTDANVPVNEQNRVRFLPPYASGMPAGDFVQDQNLEIWFYELDPVTLQAAHGRLGAELTIGNGAIVNAGETYATTAVAIKLVRQIRTGHNHIRAEIRLPNGPDAPVCNEQSARCLGYLDIFLFDGKDVRRDQAPPGFVPAPNIASVLPIRFKLLFPDSIDQVLGIVSDTLFAGTGNCPSPYLTLPGQGLQAVGAGLQAVGAGLQAVGAVGGLFHGGPEDPDKFMLASAMGTEIRDYLPAGSGAFAKRDAVVFVVDDFSSGYGLMDLFTADLSQAAPEVSHGALVMQHLRELAGLPGDFDPVPAGYGPGGQPYYVLPVGANFLYLQTVDTGGGDTEETARQLRVAVDYYTSVKSVTYMVVNMSFAIVPCSVLDDYRLATQLSTFDDYLLALASVNSVSNQYRDRFNQLVSSPVHVPDDELLNFLADPGTDSVNLLQVASAGNYGNCYALYPAALAHVISVGALEPAGGENIELCTDPPVPLAQSGGNYVVSGYSNLAEVAAPGGLFKLGMAGDDYLAYAGTSFSAPAVSLFLALDSMLSTPGCQIPAAGTVPALADGVYDMLPFYADVVPSALGTYCHGLP